MPWKHSPRDEARMSSCRPSIKHPGLPTTPSLLSHSFPSQEPAPSPHPQDLLAISLESSLLQDSLPRVRSGQRLSALSDTLLYRVERLMMSTDRAKAKRVWVRKPMKHPLEGYARSRSMPLVPACNGILWTWKGPALWIPSQSIHPGLSLPGARVGFPEEIAPWLEFPECKGEMDAIVLKSSHS